MKSSHLLIALLVVASLLAGLAVTTAVAMGDFGRPTPFGGAWFALATSQFGLTTGWFVFGRRHVLLRLAALIGVLEVWSFAASHVFLPTWAEWRYYFLLLAVAISGVLDLARVLGVRATGGDAVSQPAAADAATERRLWQFSLGQLMLWTTLLAAALAARQLITVPHWAHAEVIHFMLVNACATLLAFWCVLGSRRPWYNGVIAALAVYLAASTLFHDSQPIWSADNLFHLVRAATEFLLLVGSLAVVRQAGYRLERRATKSDKQNSAEANPEKEQSPENGQARTNHV